MNEGAIFYRMIFLGNGLKMKKWLISIFLVGGIFVFFNQHEERVLDQADTVPVLVLDGGFGIPLVGVRGKTVGEVFVEAGIEVSSRDLVFPERETRIFSGMKIHLVRSHEFRVSIDGGERVFWSEASSIEEAILWEGIHLDGDDIVKPARMTRPSFQTRVSVIRVEIREEAKEAGIPFETKVVEDASLSWRKKVTTQKGEKGIRTTVYRVAYHDNKEVNRRVLRTEVTKNPVPEAVTQGTLVQVGKSHRGAASWYAYTGTMAAANPWLPKGSYVRVTNTDNGKSVIVVINDRGPFAPGRIIDLDKVAFMKIASLGAGVINVKMEEITN